MTPGGGHRGHKETETTMAKNFSTILSEALAMGAVAGAAVVPVPMTVADSKQTYFVADGVCGFGWVSFAGNTAFGKWAKANKHASPGYPKGLQIWSKLMTQSLARNEAWAYAVAASLRGHGIDAVGHSRID